MKDIFSKLPKPGLGPFKLPASPALPPLPKLPPIFDGIDLSKRAISQAGKMIEGGAGFVTTTLGNVPFFGSLETATDYDHERFDEKHYFLIPVPDNEDGFAVYVMRCLPAGVPPINDLPKQRFVHLPSPHALPMLKDLMLTGARERAADTLSDPNFVTDNLGRIIDEIDKVDDKAFKGILLVGGLVALINPLTGAAIAVNAIIPSIGLIVSKHGLKMASDTATNMDLAKRIKRAEKDVEGQFQKGKTFQIINPLLAQLPQSAKVDHWLTDEDDLHFLSEDIALTPADIRRLLGLSEQAVVTVCGKEAAKSVSQLSRLILSDLED